MFFKVLVLSACIAAALSSPILNLGGAGAHVANAAGTLGVGAAGTANDAGQAVGAAGRTVGDVAADTATGIAGLAGDVLRFDPRTAVARTENWLHKNLNRVGHGLVETGTDIVKGAHTATQATASAAGDLANGALDVVGA